MLRDVLTPETVILLNNAKPRPFPGSCYIAYVFESTVEQCSGSPASSVLMGIMVSFWNSLRCRARLNRLIVKKQCSTTVPSNSLVSRRLQHDPQSPGAGWQRLWAGNTSTSLLCQLCSSGQNNTVQRSSTGAHLEQHSDMVCEQGRPQVSYQQHQPLQDQCFEKGWHMPGLDCNQSAISKAAGSVQVQS